MPEFVDTIFLRLRKKPVIFLHWYHHIMTMIYCWYGNQLGTFFNCSGWYFASMNLTVHAIMYTYYGLAAMGYGRAMAKRGLNKVITTIQLAQMVGGIVILFYSTGCDKFDTNGFAAASVMYGSYLLLFGKLFIDKYILDGHILKVLPKDISSDNLVIQVNFVCLNNQIVSGFKKIFSKYQISVNKILSYDFLKGLDTQENVNIFELANYSINGLCENEVLITDIIQKKQGFFEKFFNFFN